MAGRILDYFARTNTAYLHARGKYATAILTKFVAGPGSDKILEIGFGTGATLVRLAASFPKTAFYGLEASGLMLDRARARLRFCGIQNRFSLRLAEEPPAVPFEADMFDVVYAESVLGIQEGANLPVMIGEIHRVLKPGGRLVLNETIWLDSIPRAEIERLNAICRTHFGIIQANGDYPYAHDWKLLLEHAGLNVVYMNSLDDEPPPPPVQSKRRVLFLSDVFSAFGRLNGLLSISHRKEKAAYKMITDHLFENKPYMKGFVMVAHKKQ
jgi:SAM-dependent methyltransferase